MTDPTLSGPTVVIAPERLTLTVARSVKERIDTVIAHGAQRVVVDLTRTSFIDSSGLGALVGGLKTARLAGGDLRIAGAGAQVLTVLRLTKLDRVLEPHGTVQDATDGW